MNPFLFLHAICLGIAAAIISVVMIVIMPNEPILNWYFRFGERVGKKLVKGVERERWFFRPIWGCEKCFAGQVSLWSYLIWHIEPYRVPGSKIFSWDVVWVALPDYSIFCHLLAVCSAIIFAVIISRYINQNE